MSGEEQERFEGYLELERYIEELQAGHVAQPPAGLTPGQTSIYRMVALFRAASPEAAEPRPEFVAKLQARLEQELQEPFSATPALEEAETCPEFMAVLQSRFEKEPQQPFSATPMQGEPEPRPEFVAELQARLEQELPPSLPQQKQPAGKQKKPQKPSRRALLTGGAAVAASLTVGAGIEWAVEHVTSSPKAITYPPLVSGIPTTWHFVTTLNLLGNDAVRFATDTIVGYVVRSGAKDVTTGYHGEAIVPDQGQIIAMSASCTHMCCIVQWQNSDRKFLFLCHDGLFTENGQVDKSSGPTLYLYPLPRLRTKIEDGKVYVEVPVSQK